MCLISVSWPWCVWFLNHDHNVFDSYHHLNMLIIFDTINFFLSTYYHYSIHPTIHPTKSNPSIHPSIHSCTQWLSNYIITKQIVAKSNCLCTFYNCGVLTLVFSHQHFNLVNYSHGGIAMTVPANGLFQKLSNMSKSVFLCFDNVFFIAWRYWIGCFGQYQFWLVRYDRNQGTQHWKAFEDCCFIIVNKEFQTNKPSGNGVTYTP